MQIGGKISALFSAVYVVSLKESTDRRQYIKEYFSKIGLDKYQFFDAMHWQSQEVKDAYNEGLVKLYPSCFRCDKYECGDEECNNTLIPQQVGNFLTHKALWSHIASTPQIALIVEDDIIFENYAETVLQKLSDHIRENPEFLSPQVPKLLRFGWAKGKDHNANNPFKIVNTPKMSNPCHAMTSGYAQKLLNKFSKIETTSDIFIHKETPSSGEGLTIYPPIASELSWSTGELPSLIHPKKLHAEYLRNNGDLTAAEKYEATIDQHIKHKFYRNFLIVGHPRCGTGFTANILNQCGFDIGHEADGKDGLSSWMFAVEDEAPYALDNIAKRRAALTWDKLILPIRNLETAVPSVMKENRYAPLSYDYRRRHIKKSKGIDLNNLSTNFERAVVSILNWVDLIEDLNPDLVFTIENQYKKLIEFAQDTHPEKFSSPESINSKPYNANKAYKKKRYDKEVISSDDWSSLPESVWNRVIHYCEKYSYPRPTRTTQDDIDFKQFDNQVDEIQKHFLPPPSFIPPDLVKKSPFTDSTQHPWLTFGAIELLSRIVRPSDRVFEYGAGYSTLWWQERVASVTSVDHDEARASELLPHLKPNAHLTYINAEKTECESAKKLANQFMLRMRRTNWPDYDDTKVVQRGLDDENYISYAAHALNIGEKFDFIIIGGMARRLCTEFAVEKLTEDGVIILNNSNRSDYDTAFDILNEAGFKQIPFWGLVPGLPLITCSSFFLRDMDRLASGEHQPDSYKLPAY